MMRRAGFRPCVGSIAVGNPPGSPEEIEERVRAFLPALRAALAAKGAWSYHAYTIDYTDNPSIEAWYSLRYRMLHDIMVRQEPRLAPPDWAALGVYAVVAVAVAAFGRWWFEKTRKGFADVM